MYFPLARVFCGLQDHSVLYRETHTSPQIRSICRWLHATSGPLLRVSYRSHGTLRNRNMEPLVPWVGTGHVSVFGCSQCHASSPSGHYEISGVTLVLSLVGSHGCNLASH